jgi:hypothetical protein
MSGDSGVSGPNVRPCEGVIALDFFEDEVRACRHDSRQTVDVPEYRLAQLLMVRGAHGEDDVDVSADSLRLLDERQFGESGGHVAPRHFTDFHDHKRGYVKTQCLPVYLGTEAGDDVPFDEVLNSGVRCRSGDVNPLSDCAHGESGVLAEFGEYLPIDAVETALVSP